MTSQKLELLVWQYLVEEQISRIVGIELHLASVRTTISQCLIEELDEHREVFRERSLQPLLLSHLLVIENVTSVLVHEEVVTFAQDFNLYDLRTFFLSLKSNKQKGWFDRCSMEEYDLVDLLSHRS